MINDGSFFEKLVQVIEQSIAPDSVVQRNVSLPILSSRNGATAQCDIVIRTGKPPRETLTIIEVQDRQRAVDINEFRGWQQKMQQVGAQHLYCVSRKPFPESIRESAALSGNTIKLITLSTIDSDKIPINFFKTTFIYLDVDISHIRKRSFSFPSLQNDSNRLKLEYVTQELSQLKTNDLKFSFYLPTVTALSTICINNVSHQQDVISQTNTLALGFDRPLFFLLTNQEFVPITLDIEFTWSAKRVEIPVTLLSYDQDDHGTLAWILESFYQSSRGPIWIKIPVTKSGDGYSISSMLLTLPENVEFIFRLQKN